MHELTIVKNNHESLAEQNSPSQTGDTKRAEMLSILLLRPPGKFGRKERNRRHSRRKSVNMMLREICTTADR